MKVNDALQHVSVVRHCWPTVNSKTWGSTCRSTQQHDKPVLHETLRSCRRILCPLGLNVIGWMMSSSCYVACEDMIPLFFGVGPYSEALYSWLYCLKYCLHDCFDPLRCNSFIQAQRATLLVEYVLLVLSRKIIVSVAELLHVCSVESRDPFPYPVTLKRTKLKYPG